MSSEGSTSGSVVVQNGTKEDEPKLKEKTFNLDLDSIIDKLLAYRKNPDAKEASQAATAY